MEMTIVILCMVVVFFLLWVILLKVRIENLKGERHLPGKPSRSAVDRDGAQKGNRSFSIE